MFWGYPFIFDNFIISGIFEKNFIDTKNVFLSFEIGEDQFTWDYKGYIEAKKKKYH